MADLSGQVLKSYRVIERLNEGGFGAIYRAYQAVVEREVAIKVILPKFANNADFIRRFESEAQIVARLEHPHIVPLYDFWRDPRGAYLVMRWLRGGSLRDLLDEERVLDLERTAAIISQIASALTIAHRQGIVHRDIKPENILFDEDDNAYLTDFGIAQKAGHDDSEQDHISGSANYIAPEQIRGEPASIKSDIYALGIMTYELITGYHPFRSNNLADILYMHLQSPMPEIQNLQIPPSINAVLQIATEKDAAHRYDTVLEFSNALQALVGGTGRVKTRTVEVALDIKNPYKGLRAFSEADTGDFFGRDTVVQTLLNRLRDDVAGANFLAVVGPSGSGKSSVVRAGLIPALRGGSITNSDNWFVTDMLPSVDPIRSLENALLSVAVDPPDNLYQQLRTEKFGLAVAVDAILKKTGGDYLLLFIDQFEETFTMVEDEEIRKQFLSLLYHAVMESSSSLFIVVTLRADFFDKPLLYEHIGDLIQTRTQIILPLSATEIESAITGPAQRVGLQVDSDLIAAIVSDVREEPGALPLLQYALTEIFERREVNRLTLASYEESGGVKGALARRAQEVYQSLNADLQGVTRQIFLRLVTLGEGSEDTRRRLKLGELLSLYTERSKVETVLDMFGQYRLLTFDQDPTDREPTVEIAHEALLYRWEALRLWLNESRNDIRLERLLAEAAHEWEERKRARGFLLQGGRLVQFEEWASQSSLTLTPRERDFLAQSIAERERQEAAIAEQEQREAALEARSKRLLRFLVAVFAVASLISVALAVFAVGQGNVARTERDNAQEARATSDFNAQEARTQLEIAQIRAREIQNLNLINTADSALDNGNSGLAIALVLEVAQSPLLTANAQNDIYELSYRSMLRQRLTGHTRKINTLAVSKDGLQLATGSEDLSIILWDGNSLSPRATLLGHQGPINSLAFSPDGTILASAGTDALIILWDVATGAEIRRLQGHQNVVTTVEFAPDGLTLISSSNDRNLILWDVATGLNLRSFVGHQGAVRTVSFSPDGFTLISGGRDNTLILWDVATASEIRRYTGHSNSIESVIFSHTGAQVLSASADRTLLLWDVASGRILKQFIGHRDVISSVVLTADDSMAISTACAERDISRNCVNGEVILWNTSTALEIRRLVGHQDNVNSVRLLPQNGQIVTASCGERRQGTCAAGELLLWDSQIASDTIRQFVGHESEVLSVARSRDGNWLASGGGSRLSGTAQGDTTIMLWNLRSGQSLRRINGHSGNVNSLQFSADGERLLSASSDGSIRLWDVSSRGELGRYIGHQGEVYRAVFSPDESQILSTGADSTILWDSESESEIRRFNNPNPQIMGRSVSFHPQGGQIAIGLNNGAILQLDPNTGAEIRRLIGHTDDVNSLSYSRDGLLLLSSSSDNTIRLWDAVTGAEIRRYLGHSNSVTRALFVHDNQQILSSAEDNTLRLWNLETGETIRIFTGHSNAIFGLSMDTEGDTVISASADGVLREWRISLKAVVEWLGANRYISQLTDEEWAQYRLMD